MGCVATIYQLVIPRFRSHSINWQHIPPKTSQKLNKNTAHSVPQVFLTTLCYILHVCYPRLYAESVPTHHAYLHTCMTNPIYYIIWSICLDAICTFECVYIYTYIHYLNIPTCEHPTNITYLCAVVVYKLLHDYLYTPYTLRIRPI